jgi:hypothetical protein
MPKYPNITVKLTGTDGNALALIGKVKDKMRRSGVESENIKLFVEEALSGDYNNVLQTCMKWVDVT